MARRDGALVANGVPEQELRLAADEWVGMGLMTMDATAGTLGMEPGWLAERLDTDRRAVQEAPPWVGGVEATPPKEDGSGAASAREQSPSPQHKSLVQVKVKTEVNLAVVRLALYMHV